MAVDEGATTSILKASSPSRRLAEACLAFSVHSARHARLGFTEIPVLVDGVAGFPTQLIAWANQNGFFDLLDRRPAIPLRRTVCKGELE